ncbi:hypothetical protein FRC11_001927 [Ceratobasidium sp. 423]|nr:hypothetical protein FRC11_001927 [Ceratobasidium sp. 423]
MRKILSRFAELRARTPQDEPPFQHIPRSEDSSLSPAHPTSGQLHGILMPDTRDRDLGSQKSSALKHGNGNGAGTVVYGREGGDIDQLVTVLPYANQGVSRRDLDRTGGREIDADSAYPEDQEGGDPPFAKPEPVFGALGDSKNREGNGSGKWDVYGSDLEDSACLRPGDIPATCFDVPFTSFAAAGLEYNTDFHKVFPNVPKDDRVLKGESGLCWAEQGD